MNTLAAKWGSFAAIVVAHDAPPVQRQEMRRAFYAGANAYRQLARVNAVACGGNEELAVANIEGWDEELRAFNEAVKAGEA